MVGVDLAPRELRGEEGRFGKRIRNFGDAAVIGEFREAGELLAPSLSHGFRKVALEIAEEQERLARAPLLAHEQHRDLRQKEGNARQRPHHPRRRQDAQTLAERPVADLVVVLEEGHERQGRKRAARTAARTTAVRRHLALKGEPLGQGAAEQFCLAIVDVIAARLSGRRDMQPMMNVVVPLRGVANGFGAFPAQPFGLVLFVLDEEVDRAIEARTDAFGDLVEDVGTAVVLDRMHRVEAQPVEVELVDPVFGVLDDEIADRARVRTVVIDRVAPRRLVTAGEKVGRVEPQIVPVRAEVIVDDVEQNRDAAPMRGLDEGLEPLRAPVGRVGRIEADAVVAPAAAAAEVGDRHQLDRGHAEGGQVIELFGRGVERPLGRERADMQFIENRVLPAKARPGVVPRISGGIDRLARPVHVLRLEPGSGVRERALRRTRRSDRARRAARSSTNASKKPSTRRAIGMSAAVLGQLETDPGLARRPQAEADPARFERRAMGPGRVVFHETPAPTTRSRAS